MSWMWRCFSSKTTFVILPDMPRQTHALIYYAYFRGTGKKNKKLLFFRIWIKLNSIIFHFIYQVHVKQYVKNYTIKISCYKRLFHRILSMYVAKSSSVLSAWATKHAVFPSSHFSHNCLLQCTKQNYICSVLQIFRGRATQKLDAIIEKDLIFPVMVIRHLKIKLSCVSRRL